MLESLEESSQSNMIKRQFRRSIPFLILALLLPVITYLAVQTQVYESRARVEPANIVIQTQDVVGALPHTWRALAQGGEERGVAMLGNVIEQTALLKPRYIRIDHIYDFYDVVSRDSAGNLVLSWDQLDETVCDILQTGAKPFFVLGYMPGALSKDGSLIAPPNNWDEWQQLVRYTIERYSGTNTRICDVVFDQLLTDVYYEVWNEPDLETFGKWSIHGGEKDYKKMYYYSAQGAKQAQNVERFFFGGPATTALYQNWIQILITYADAFDLPLDFISWHHYSENPGEYGADVVKLQRWLGAREYEDYRNVPFVISEWGFDSDPNPLADTDMAAAHTIATIRNLIEEKLEMAFAFEIKDGPIPRWGMLTYDGVPKARYRGLTLLNSLGKSRILVHGEGSHVKALASREFRKVSAVIVNFDRENSHEEIVPVTFEGLTPGRYHLVTRNLDGTESTLVYDVPASGVLSRILPLKPNSAVALELILSGDGGQ